MSEFDPGRCPESFARRGYTVRFWVSNWDKTRYYTMRLSGETAAYNEPSPTRVFRGVTTKGQAIGTPDWAVMWVKDTKGRVVWRAPKV